jgi:site-specific recombinase XerD
VSLGYSPDGKRRRRKVFGRNKTEVRQKLRALHEDIAANVKAPATYTVARAVDDWLTDGLDGRSEKTVEKYRYVLKPVVAKIGRCALRDLTAHDVSLALSSLARRQSSSTVAIAHNALTRAIRYAEARDKVRRNVSSLVDTPKGQTGRPSKAMTLAQAKKLISIASDLEAHNLGAYVVLCLQTGIRTEEARALRWEHVDLDGRPDEDPPVPASIAVWRSVREHGDTKTQLSRRTLSLPEHAAELLREHRLRQDQAREQAGKVWQESGLVFCTGLGTKLDAGNVRRQLKAVTEAAGLGRDWTPQELRHRIASTPAGARCPTRRRR